MTPYRHVPQLLSLVGIAALLTASVGCGDGRPGRVPVSGQVLIDGKPLARGFIRLVPGEARAASGEIRPDGRFVLKTFETGDGAVLGTHQVAIIAVEPLGGNKQRWHAPKKYADPETSGLTITIDGPTESLQIDLTWDGGQAFVETLSD